MNKETIVHIAAEVTPYSKVGGLGDVVGSLPDKLCELDSNIDNIVITPYYNSIKKPLKCIGDFDIECNLIQYQYSVYLDKKDRITYVFIKLDKAFSIEDYYVDGSKPYLIDVGLEYIFFGKCCIDYFKRKEIKVDKIITHDWHASGIYCYLPKDMKTIHIIHNYQHQGQLYPDIIKYFEPDVQAIAERIVSETGMISMNSFAICKADKIVTVSENYAKELMNKKVPHPGLDLFRIYGKGVIGILNGVDYDKWNPERNDISDVEPYTYHSLDHKASNKKKLKEILHLNTPDDRPLVLMLSRLTQQKGLDLFINMGNRRVFDCVARMENFISLGYDFIICGVPAGGYAGEVDRQLHELSLKNSSNFRYIDKYSDELAHTLLSGCDILLHVSNYEPCGLTPMYSMKYGVVPVVSKRGGLVDIVTDYMLDNQSGNGFFVTEVSYECLSQTMLKIRKIYEDKKAWLNIIKNCMYADFSWNNSAKKYLGLLESI